jgi:hypothetical protein
MAARAAHPTPDQAAKAREIVAGQAEAHARRMALGSHLRPEGYAPFPKVETVEAVEARLVAARATMRAFMQTPRGRFVATLERLTADHWEAAVRLRGIYDRHLWDEREPLDVAAVGEALLVLNPLDTVDAQECSDALAELLIAAPASAKAA